MLQFPNTIELDEIEIETYAMNGAVKIAPHQKGCKELISDLLSLIVTSSKKWLWDIKKWEEPF